MILNLHNMKERVINTFRLKAPKVSNELLENEDAVETVLDFGLTSLGPKACGLFMRVWMFFQMSDGIGQSDDLS